MMVLVDQNIYFKTALPYSNANWTSFSYLLQNGTAPSAEDITHCQTKRLCRIVGIFEQIVDN